jgi:4-amino-4-deoxy-L-arabinose transferase-like glycosyltransferase
VRVALSEQRAQRIAVCLAVPIAAFFVVMFAVATVVDAARQKWGSLPLDLVGTALMGYGAYWLVRYLRGGDNASVPRWVTSKWTAVVVAAAIALAFLT